MLQVPARSPLVPAPRSADGLKALLTAREARIAIIGLGYVGLPLARAAWKAGFRILGFDIDQEKVRRINAGESYLRQIASEEIAGAVDGERLEATTDFSRICEADVIVICVPTPLTAHREPDLSHIASTLDAIANFVRPSQLLILESTTWPGTTQEVMQRALEQEGFTCGTDLFLAFSPEREDPGNPKFSTVDVPKVVGADDPVSLDLADAFYRGIVTTTVRVSSSRTAEAVKLTENIFRSVNIALVNELKTIYGALGIDVWEVIDAASTKPFGFMPFYPGPGLGGHCIPIDPFYLTWKAREHEISTRFIELAGEINTQMPHLVVERLHNELDRRFARGLTGARILLVGMAYKKNVEDIRESASLKLMRLLERRGAQVDYFDPYIPSIPGTREYVEFAGRTSVAWPHQNKAPYDAALIATDHDCVDYKSFAESISLIIDTRNVYSRLGLSLSGIVKA
ncbi:MULTISPECIES: nucleotide sugar dehydrogenase [unclassified Methylobacterium]|jgi:UDP-N-acetyl-D-glucosamine dehydrogenase|uniref:nucleotide sugar dehydrogenase n=1 Tax=unclassified Methylobacterium TaxID=2615210 RepID=UPI001354F456|nr:nucleotide sugar dehydrogenase [Methylobacterium sp. 2A]MWV24696.1 nucleotide sugar dehydrogenase [Methylobacterium sp. 2A]